MNLSGTLTSDFMKLVSLPVEKRKQYIDYTNTDFLSLRDGLIQYAKSVYPNDYQYFVESDLGMMFLEMVAYMGAVMSMKADMLANENFLETAKQRESVAKLLNLIGVNLRGPLSAAADVELELSEISTTDWKIAAGNRIVTTTSPEDGGQVTYTIYMVENGNIKSLEAPTADITVPHDATGTLYSNFAIQEGALVTDEGSFSITEDIKTISLTQGPVVDGSVQVYVSSTNAEVNGGYTQVDNVYFASGSSDKVFEVVYDTDFNATVVFGNGIAGVSPDPNSEYFVSYRIGGGTRGNIEKNGLSSEVIVENTSVAGTTCTITNTSKGTGGANAETIERAKKYAPLTFRRQDRLVTLLDYQTYANTFISTWGTVGKAAAATRRAYASANTIDIYVLEKASDLQLQKATPTFKTELLSGINQKKMATDEVVIVDGLIRTIDLDVTVKINEEDKAGENAIIGKVRNKLLGYMGVDNREFGEALDLSDLNRQMFEIDEVIFSSVNNLDQNVLIDFNEILQLNNLTINVEYLK